MVLDQPVIPGGVTRDEPLLARRASCLEDLLAPQKNSLAPGKRTGVLSGPVRQHADDSKQFAWSFSPKACVILDNPKGIAVEI